MKEDLLARSNVTDCSPAQVKRLRPKETKNGITTKCDFSLYTCIRLQTLEAHFKHLNVCVCEGKGRGRICSISTILFGFLFLPFMGTCYFFSPIDYFFLSFYLKRAGSCSGYFRSVLYERSVLSNQNHLKFRNSGNLSQVVIRTPSCIK